jgi:hypothetical protein
MDLIKTFFMNLAIEINNYYVMFYRWLRTMLFVENAVEVLYDELDEPVSLYFRYQLIKMMNGMIRWIELLRDSLDIKISNGRITYFDKIGDKKMIISEMTLNEINNQIRNNIKETNKNMTSHIVLKMELMSKEDEKIRLCLKNKLQEYNKNSNNTLKKILMFEASNFNEDDELNVHIISNKQQIKKNYKIRDILNENIHKIVEII